VEGDGDERSPIGPSEEMQALTMTTEKARHSMIFQYSILFHHAIYSFIHLLLNILNGTGKQMNAHTHICIYIYIYTCTHAFTYIIYSRHTDIHTH
jgi:hypothetical protein